MSATDRKGDGSSHRVRRLGAAIRGGFERAFGDTLARRIFLLLWVTLVVAQALAIGVVTWTRGDLYAMRMHGAPSLPPMPGLMRGPQPQGPGPGQPGMGADPELRDEPPLPGDVPMPPREGFRGFPPPPQTQGMQTQGMQTQGPQPQWRGPFRALTAWELTLDYGIRLLVTGLAAWIASRWLSRPMRDLVRASQALGQSLNQQDRLPLLDEKRGTLEVRESAQVFNAMARQLRRQFNERGLMVAAISHDLRTPLTRLRMRLETLDIEEIQRQRSVEDIREMNALVDAVMELFRGDGPGAAEPLVDVDLGALAQALTDDLIEQSMPVGYVEDGEPVLAKGQPMALRRVLGNLIGNAIRYGGSAEVRVGRDSDGVWLRVTDPGPGIPADKLEAVFEPFYRLEDSRNRHTGGAGLGLYIARELTLRQRGSLVLSNRPEGGLMAEVRLTG
ncbi:ATP-binding protein [Roseateles chitinivorans]|uniref:ATP-binding protein n=1 Tax=Roseateles chitinivorans TaxID=2917965 RepID=UPI003D66D74F